jgi:hypothetical protein
MLDTVFLIKGVNFPMLPLRLGSSDQFATVREFFGQAGYCEQAVCKRLGLGGVHEYLGLSETSSSTAPAEASDALEFLLRLFLVGNPASHDLLDGFLPKAVRESMESLELLRTDSAHPEQCYSPVVLYPVQCLYIASDRWKNPDGSSLPAGNDFVFPGIHPLTHDFLELLPQSPCDKFLDLCSGTAIAALLASKRYARRSWAVDITVRAAHFGEFNRLLNQLSNSTMMQGNLYGPVNGNRFDRIVAHPPYVPAMEPGAIYADGGEDGELITRAVVQGPLSRPNCDPQVLSSAPGQRPISANLGALALSNVRRLPDCRGPVPRHDKSPFHLNRSNLGNCRAIRVP